MRFEAQLGTKDGFAPRGIDNQFASQHAFFSVLFYPDAVGCAIRAELDFFDARALEDARSFVGGMLQQKLIEAAAVYVIGVILAEAQFGHLAKADNVFAWIGPMRPDRAVLVDELLSFHYREELDVLKNA